MSTNEFVSALILGFGLLGLATSSYAAGMGGGMGGMGGGEETRSEALLYNDLASYAVHGDGEAVQGAASLYQDAQLSGSTDCALVLTPSSDKPNGTAFLWAPAPNSADCDDPLNRTININQPSDLIQSPWPGNPRLDYNQDEDVDDVEAAFLRLELGGAYAPLDEMGKVSEDVFPNIRVLELGSDGSVTSGAKFIIDYRVQASVTADPENSNIRTVEASNDVADICEVMRSGKKGNKVTCQPIAGGIRLPFKVTFTRPAP